MDVIEATGFHEQLVNVDCQIKYKQGVVNNGTNILYSRFFVLSRKKLAKMLFSRT